MAVVQGALLAKNLPSAASHPEDVGLYQRLVESVSDYAIYMLTCDGTVTSWNLGAERVKGYRAEEIVGRNFELFYTAEDRALNKPQRTLSIASKDGRFEDKAWRVRKNGDLFRAHVIVDAIYDDDGGLTGFAKITRDISEEWEKERQLIESERRFRMLVSGVTDYAIYMLSLDGHISSWNAGAERFKNYSEEEVLGRHFSMFYTQEDRTNEKPDRALKTALESGRFEDEGWRVRKDGRAFWAHVIIDLIRDEQGRPAGFAKITRDMSDRREAELRLKNLSRSNQELEQFVQIASHDLREPLRKILSFSGLLAAETQGQLSEEGKLYLSSISSATQRMQALLGSLLSLSRVTTHGQAFAACDLNSVLSDVLSDLALLIQEKGARCEIHNLPTIEADGAQMRQLFQNLIGNSLKYARDDVEPRITVRELATNQASIATIAVSDNGIGFDPQYVDRIFGVFQRLHTRDAYEGAGIGLSVCQRICQRHKGDIGANAKLGVGANFTVSLPREQRKTVE